ncbi:MAG TPA: hypothetical protein PK036_17565 [Geobacteraceae bacterium]|nr:hypothetical protein [Geobacteraceae bacterium]
MQTHGNHKAAWSRERHAVNEDHEGSTHPGQTLAHPGSSWDIRWNPLSPKHWEMGCIELPRPEAGHAAVEQLDGFDSRNIGFDRQAVLSLNVNGIAAHGIKLHMGVGFSAVQK